MNPGGGPVDENKGPLCARLTLELAEGADVPKRLLIGWAVDEDAAKFISELENGAEVCILPKSELVGADVVGYLLELPKLVLEACVLPKRVLVGADVVG